MSHQISISKLLDPLKPLPQAWYEQYEKEGYLIIENFLGEEELDALRADLEVLIKREGPEIYREANGSDAVRLFFHSNKHSDVYDALSRDERVLNIARELVGSDVYIHQLRVNPKSPGHGEAWSWHQDFAAWHKQDGIQKPNALIFGILLDDSTPVNGPLVIIPGSHNEGFIDGKTIEGGAGKYATTGIPESTIKRLSDKNGFIPVLGKAGSVVIMHPNMIHASPNNISPDRRTMIYIIYNAVDNPPTYSNRPDFLCNRDVTPLVAHPSGTLGNFLSVR